MSSTEAPTPPAAEVFEIVGTVTYQEMEGGFYGIEAEDGSKYDPLNLPESFKKDGLKVQVKAQMKTDVIGFHMYGSIIEVMDIVAR